MSGKTLINMAQPIYVHNSSHKDYIRDKWIQFARDIVKDNSMGIITFPAEEMQDLQLFVKEGLIEWRETESGAYHIDDKQYKVICFEKSTTIFRSLQKKLVGAHVFSDEIGSFFRSKYQAIMNKRSKVFPVDVVNLDYDGNISKNNVPISEVIKLLFQYQALHKKDFSLFLTWPSTEKEDDEDYKNLLRATIEENLDDHRAEKFTSQFNSEYGSVDNIDYEKLSIIGLSKIVIKNSTENKYSLHQNEFYIYGESGRKRMFSVLFNFIYSATQKTNKLYSTDVPKSLQEIIVLAE